MSRARILLADDHSIVTAGIRSVLEPEFEVVGTVQDGRALLEAARDLQPDVIVIDISMPLLNGMDAARRIRAADSRVKLVFLTMHADTAYVKSAFRLGASGYLVKRTAADELPDAVRAVLNGNAYLTPLLTNDMMREFLVGAPRGDKDDLGELTSRQREVLQLICEGRSTKQIAAILNISSKTVLFHKYRIMEELDLNTVAELTQFAIRRGLLSAESGTN